MRSGRADQLEACPETRPLKRWITEQGELSITESHGGISCLDESLMEDRQQRLSRSIIDLPEGPHYGFDPTVEEGPGKS